jgi:hypothetical protein
MEARSSYPVYIYNSHKILLAIIPSARALANKTQSTHTTIVTYIKNGSLFRGEWYFTNIPYNIEDTPIITEWFSTEGNALLKEICQCIKIKKAVFVYDKNKKFIAKHDGVTEAGKVYKTSHLTIKKCANSNTLHANGYHFCYERLDSNKDERN